MDTISRIERLGSHTGWSPALAMGSAASARALGAGPSNPDGLAAMVAAQALQADQMLEMLMLLAALMANGDKGQPGGSGGGQGSAGAGGASGSPGGGQGSAGTGGASGPSGGGSVSNPSEDTADRGQIESFIQEAAAAYGADPEVLLKMAEKESGFQTDVQNDWDSNAQKGTPSRGLFQFIEPTFDDMAPKARAANPEAWANLGELDWNDWRQQALTAAWAVANGQASHWSTFAAAGGK